MALGLLMSHGWHGKALQHLRLCLNKTLRSVIALFRIFYIYTLLISEILIGAISNRAVKLSGVPHE